LPWAVQAEQAVLLVNRLRGDLEQKIAATQAGVIVQFLAHREAMGFAVYDGWHGVNLLKISAQNKAK
jgi:hypothetical protein